MPDVIPLGSDYHYDSANSISDSYIFHSGTNKKLLVAVTIRATTPVISGVTADGTGLVGPWFSTLKGDMRTSFYYLDDANFPAAGSRTIACSTSGTSPKVAMSWIELGNAEQGALASSNADSSDDASPLDVSVKPDHFGGLVFYWAGRSGASAITATITGSETYIRDDLQFDYSAFEAAYVIHHAAGQCAIETDISSASNFVAGAVAVNPADGSYQNNGLFFGTGL